MGVGAGQMTNMQLPLAPEHKLRVLSRVEPGCLGPDGKLYVEDFCVFAQQEFNGFHSDYSQVILVPRFDKNLPEVQYSLNGKQLDEVKVVKFLSLFGQDAEHFEYNMHSLLAKLIDRYLGR